MPQKLQTFYTTTNQLQYLCKWTQKPKKNKISVKPPQLQTFPSCLNQSRNWITARKQSLQLWRKILKITKSSLSPCRYTPSLCFLGDMTQVAIPTTYRKYRHTKKISFQNWKSKKSCHITYRINPLTEHISTEKIILYRKKNIPVFNETWNTFLTHLNLKQNTRRYLPW